jgi:hypothetical protein
MPKRQVYLIQSLTTFLVLASLSQFAKADAVDQRLLGAWAQSKSDCAMFETKNGKIAFRQPINEFVPGFIISQGGIVATGGQCAIGKVSSSGDQITMSLSCNNSVGFAPVTGRFKIVSENEIVYGATDNPILDTNYERCL